MRSRQAVSLRNLHNTVSTKTFIRKCERRALVVTVLAESRGGGIKVKKKEIKQNRRSHFQYGYLNKMHNVLTRPHTNGDRVSLIRYQSKMKSYRKSMDAVRVWIISSRNEKCVIGHSIHNPKYIAIYTCPYEQQYIYSVIH